MASPRDRSIEPNKPEGKKTLSLLLIDDDAELCVMLMEFFAQLGHRMESAYNGRDGLAQALNGAYDLIVLDVMLPILDGFAVLEQLRRRKSVPVIMLTARGQRHMRIQGLESGADDYLSKPFGPDELHARIRAVLRRSSGSLQGPQTFSAGNVRINRSTRGVWVSGSPVELTSMEFDILELLLVSAGLVVSRDEITNLLFGRVATPFDRFLDVHISNLRRKLGRGRPVIRTIRGVGYMFAAETQE